MADIDGAAAQGAIVGAGTLENTIANKKSVSYSDSLSMWSDDDIEFVLESLRDLRNSADNFHSSFSKAENDIIYCSWYNTATGDSEFYDHVWNNVINGAGFEAETLKNIFYDDGEETGGLKGFNDAPNFSHLISAIEELRQAIIDYSNGTNVYAARDILSTLINIGEGDDSFLGNSSYYGAASAGTLSAPSIESIEPTKTVETPKNEDVTPIFSTDIEKNDELDGADNIPMEDSVTDDITKVSAKDLLIDAVKNSNGIVSAGAASALGNAFSKGIGSSKIDSKLKAEKLDDIIEPEEPIPNLDEDGDNLFDDVVSTVTSIVTPDVPSTTINGKKVEGKAGSGIAIPAIAGVGVASAGVVGGKVYMDKKKSDDDSEDDDDNKFDDFEFENSEGNQEEVVNNNDSKENVVDFKNKIMDDNL